VPIELRQDKSLRRSIRKIAFQHFEKIHASLSNSKNDFESIHVARKNFKRLRALLRLVRPAIGESRYKGENEEFRTASRPLSEIRDAKALVEALSRLKKR